MNRTRLFAIVICAIIVACIFWVGRKTSDFEPRPAAANTSAKGKASETNESSLSQAALKRLKPEAASRVAELNAMLNQRGNDKQRTALLEQLSFVYDSLGEYGLSGLYAERLAEATNNTGTWFVAATQFTNALQFAQSEGEKGFYISGGKKSARRVLAAEPENLKAKNLLAECIISESDDSIMTVIPMLKAIEAKDSNNRQALHNLAMLSRKSGQTPKAIKRYQKLTKLEPLNPEYHFSLAELLEETGDKKGAADSYNKCLPLMKDGPEKKTIEQKVHELQP